MRVFAFAAALRRDSFNRKLIRLAAQAAERAGASVDHADFHEFDMPLYDGDVEAASGIPAGAQKLRERFLGADAFMIATPEYNYSIPGVLKNAIDWVSRSQPQPFHERHGLLLSASPSMAGGNRGLWALRVPFEHLGARIYPDMFSLAQAHQAFDAEGRIANPLLQDRFNATMAGFMDLVEAVKHYPCARTRWVEFLGEHPDPVLDRVE